MNLVKRIDRLQKQNQKLREEIRSLKEEIRLLKLENQQLRAALYGFKPKRGKAKAKAKGKSKAPGEGEGPGKKKLGPPAGHKGASRPRPEKIDLRVRVDQDRCNRCGSELSRPQGYHTRVVEEVVPLPLVVIEYALVHRYCSSCKRLVYPSVPGLLPNLRFGPNLMLFITYLRFALNLPYNKIAGLLNACFGAGVCEGTLVDYVRRMAELMGPYYEELKARLRMENLHADETGKRVAGANRWLWVFASKEMALYHTSRSRGGKVTIEVLGEDYDGVLCSDFYSAYSKAPGRKQKCWSHLLRDAGKLAKARPPPGALELHAELKELFRELQEARDYPEEERSAARERIHSRLLEIGSRSYEHFALKRLAKRIRKHASELVTTLEEDIEATNNHAERMLRPCVVQRKVWGCLRSEWGSRAHDVVMSVLQTWKLQGKNYFKEGKEFLSSRLL